MSLARTALKLGAAAVSICGLVMLVKSWLKHLDAMSRLLAKNPYLREVMATEVLRNPDSYRRSEVTLAQQVLRAAQAN